jgi:hypothetical protein
MTAYQTQTGVLAAMKRAGTADLRRIPLVGDSESRWADVGSTKNENRLDSLARIFGR